MILVMGVTGSGKSYFINQLAKDSVVEGHGVSSGESCSFSGRLTYKLTDIRDKKLPGGPSQHWSARGCARRHAWLR